MILDYSSSRLGAFARWRALNRTLAIACSEIKSIVSYNIARANATIFVECLRASGAPKMEI
jgi:hypothetical protein